MYRPHTSTHSPILNKHHSYDHLILPHKKIINRRVSPNQSINSKYQYADNNMPLNEELCDPHLYTFSRCRGTESVEDNGQFYMDHHEQIMEIYRSEN